MPDTTKGARGPEANPSAQAAAMDEAIRLATAAALADQAAGGRLSPADAEPDGSALAVEGPGATSEAAQASAMEEAIRIATAAALADKRGHKFLSLIQPMGGVIERKADWGHLKDRFPYFFTFQDMCHGSH